MNNSLDTERRDPYAPKNALENALRVYERVHREWMNCPIHRAGEAEESKTRLDEAREKYLAEYRKAHPTHIAW